MYESSFRVYKMLCCGIFCNLMVLCMHVASFFKRIHQRFVEWGGR